MPSDEAGSNGGRAQHPRYRRDCIDLYCKPDETEEIDFTGPTAVMETIEQAAEQSGRTFNEQFKYVMNICMGSVVHAADDARSVDEWRGLIGQLRIQFHKGEEWMPASVLFAEQSASEGRA